MTTATDKQISFLRSLQTSRTLPLALANDLELALDIEYAALSKRDASRFIEACLACPKAPRAKAPTADVAEGWYSKDGEIAKVQKAVHGSGRLYAKLLVVERHFTPFEPNPYMPGYVAPDTFTGSWEYKPGLIGKIAREGWAKLTLEEAEKFGKLYGICGCCGRTLTNEESIAKGIGPICASRL